MLCYRRGLLHRELRQLALIEATILQHCLAARPIASIDYGDGLSPSLTNPQGTDITTIAQRRPQHPRRPGRDRSEQLVAIRWNGWSRSPVCAMVGRFDGPGPGTIGLSAAWDSRVCASSGLLLCLMAERGLSRWLRSSADVTAAFASVSALLDGRVFAMHSDPQCENYLATHRAACAGA
jgi:hypothetical protein